MKHFFLITLCIFLFSFIGKRNSKPYDFSRPSEIITLPDNLHEVSGLTVLDSSSVGCIQDENGVLYIYNIQQRKITKEIPFHFNGDYEDITRVGKRLYVLRSDGVLYEIDNFQSENPEVKTHETGIPANNNEGLCYDRKNNRLLIAVKGKADKTEESKDLRLIYAFDLATGKMKKDPAYSYSLQTVNEFIAKNQIQVKEKKKKKNPDHPKKKQADESNIKFASSAIGIHPVSQKLYLLSAADHMLFIFHLKGNIEHAELLDQSIYNKSEGLAFFENGDLIISNEGQDKKPTLVFLPYKK